MQKKKIVDSFITATKIQSGKQDIFDVYIVYLESNEAKNQNN